jgi:outer membrane receptor protein involved in Fe transport
VIRRTALPLALTILLGAAAPPAAPADEPPAESPAAEPAAAEAPAAEAPGGDAPETAAEAPEGEVWYDEIVISASREEARLEDIPLHASVIEGIAVRRAPDTNLTDIARQIPGLVLAGDESGLVANARSQSLNFRGVSGAAVSHALLLVDGFPLLDPYNASAIWSKVPKELVDRIEVVRGGGANLWGSLALSGVVNVITRSPADRRLDAGARLGSLSTGDASLAYSDLGERWSGWLAGNYFDTDGYQTRRPEDQGAVDRPEFRQYESLSGRVSYDVAPNAVAHVGLRLYDEERCDGTELNFSSDQEQALSAALDLVAGSGSGELRLFAREGALEDTAATVSADRSTQTPRYHIPDLSTENVGLSALWGFGGAGVGSISAGADLQASSIARPEDHGWNGSEFTQRNVVEGSQQFYGAFVQDRWTPSERWSVEGGLRFDSVRTHDGTTVRTDLVTGAVTEEVVLDAHTETTWSPRVGAVFQASDSSRWRGAAYTGFRSPTPVELFVAQTSSGNRENAPNPALEPETLLGAELGYDFTRGQELTARATAFWSRTENLIQRVTVGRVGPSGGFVGDCGFVGPNGSCTQRRNTGETRATGLELDASWTPHPRWRLVAGAALIEAEIVDNPDDPDLEGNRIERTPELGTTFGVEYRHPRLDAQLRGRYASDRYEDPENLDRIPGYFVLDLSLGHRLNERWELFGGVENLLDRDYDVSVETDGSRKVGAPRMYHAGFRFRSGAR